MRHVLDFIDLAELPHMLALMGILTYVGRQMCDRDTHRWAQRFGGGMFLLYGVCGIGHYEATTVSAITGVAFKALLAAALFYSLCSVIVPSIVYVYRPIGRYIRKQRLKWHERTLARIAKEKTDLAQRLEQARLKNLPPPPAPLTADQRGEQILAQAARKRDSIVAAYNLAIQAIQETEHDPDNKQAAINMQMEQLTRKLGDL